VDDDVMAIDLAAADSVVAAWIEAERVPGAVLHVAGPDGQTHVRVFGSAQLYAYGAGQYEAWRDGDAGGLERLPDPVALTDATVFDLASVTKVMATTMATMLLVDDGRLDLDVPVAQHLPEFTGDGKEAITPRHLLTHRSGLSQWQPIYYHASSPAEAVDVIRRLPLEWEVGAERHYSDLGFMLLGALVERISGMELDAFLQDALYLPLGLEHTGFRRPAPDDGPAGPFAATSHGNPFERRMVHDREFGYAIDGDPDAWSDWREHTLVGEVNDGNAWHAFGGVAGHAGLFSTAAELGTLLRLLLDRGEHDGLSILSPSTVDAFLASTGDAQALGWQLPDYAPSGSFGHTGFTGTFVLGIPDRGLSVVLLTNRQNLGVDADSQYPNVAPLQRQVTEALTARGR
jgi:CubicO group peptidase (beta-lactamase class C family)